MREKLLISACLLGENCKYSGGNNYEPLTEALGERFELVPVCPERLGGLTSPREPAERGGLDSGLLSGGGADIGDRPKGGDLPGGAQGAQPLLRLRGCL